MEKEKKNEEFVFRTPDGKVFEVPPEGSIGLLALGAVGLKAWREARRKARIAKMEDMEGNLEINEQPEV